MGIDQCKTIELPVVANKQGDLAFAEAESHIPFPIARAFYVYDIPAAAVRGGHAHYTLHEALFCLTGRLDITVDDGKRRHTHTLEDPSTGIYLPPMIWYDIDRFTAGSVYLAFASAPFDEADYIRDYDEYLQELRSRRAGAPEAARPS